MKTKKETLKARGIRFSDAQWSNIEKDATKDKSGRTTPSDVVRHIVDEHYEGKKKPR
jgi:hypothetical protein